MTDVISFTKYKRRYHKKSETQILDEDDNYQGEWETMTDEEREEYFSD